MSTGFTTRLGGKNSEFVAITVYGLSYPDSSDWEDGNWLDTKVAISAGGFRGKVGGHTRAEEYEKFLEGLVPLYESLKGEAGFATMEEWLTINVKGDGGGHTSVEIEIKDAPGVGNTLTCRLTLDQTYLRDTIADLRVIVEQFPERGDGRGRKKWFGVL